MIYPWQQAQWQQLWQAKQSQRFPHALLLTGIAGIGKAVFADELANAMLCQQLSAEGFACHQCHLCRVFEGKTHPNMLWIAPEKPGQAIKIDQIREVGDFIQQTGLQGNNRVVIIHPANSMNIHAANALLKTLEEPSSGALLILISDQYNRLPATIISRCQRIIFPVPPQDLAMHWLKQALPDAQQDLTLLLNVAQGAPLKALQLHSDESLSLREALYKAMCDLAQPHADPLKLAAGIEDANPLQLLDYMLTWVMDLSRLQLNLDVITNLDYSAKLAALKTQIPLAKSIQLLDDLQHQRKQIAEGINLNKQLVLETILIRWQAACKQGDVIC